MRLALVALVALAAAVWCGAAHAVGPCTTTSYPGLQPTHLASIDAKPHYNSFPPTSGPHYYLPARWNIYTFAIPQVALVHNLEHGGIVVQYGKRVPKATVRKIRAWYLEDSTGLVVAPLPALGAKIALTAWNAPPYKQGAEKQDAGRGWLASCSRFDAAVFTAFVKTHRFKAGERFPRSALKRTP
jgi:hypothetical protein